MVKVVAAVLRRDNTFLLARRAKHKVHPGKWEFPGGKVNPEESPQKALERELLEEFGIFTKTGDHVLTSNFQYENFEIELMAYKTTYLKGSFVLHDHDEIVWVTAREMKSYDLTGADIAIWKVLEGEL